MTGLGTYLAGFPLRNESSDEQPIHFSVAPTRPFLRSIPARLFFSTTKEKRQRLFWEYLFSTLTLLKLLAIILYLSGAWFFFYGPQCFPRKDASYHWLLPLVSCIFVFLTIVVFVFDCYAILRGILTFAVDIEVAYGLSQMTVTILAVVITMYRCHKIQHIIGSLLQVLAAILVFLSALGTVTKFTPRRINNEQRRFTGYNADGSVRVQSHW